MRAVADMQFEQPPFYELPPFEDLSASGGGNGLRGVPGGRAAVRCVGGLRMDPLGRRRACPRLGVGLSTVPDVG